MGGGNRKVDGRIGIPDGNAKRFVSSMWFVCRRERESECVCVVKRARVRVPEIIFVHTCRSETPNERVKGRELLADNSESKALIFIMNFEYEKLEKMDSETYNSTILVMG